LKTNYFEKDGTEKNDQTIPKPAVPWSGGADFRNRSKPYYWIEHFTYSTQASQRPMPGVRDDGASVALFNTAASPATEYPMRPLLGCFLDGRGISMRTKATHCRDCGSPDLYHTSARCKPCTRRREYFLKHGSMDGYNPHPPHLAVGDTCPKCERTVRAGWEGHSTCVPCRRTRYNDLQRERRKSARKEFVASIVKPKARPKATEAQRMPEVIGKARKPVSAPAVVIPAGSKVVRIPSACPDFRKYCEGPGLRL